jgi:DNA-binding response OmpR family regulator
MSRQVLVIEADEETFVAIGAALGVLSCEVKHVGDGREALAEAMSHSYDLIILDLSLQQLNGLELCCRIRGIEPYMPIIMLSSEASETDHVLGLELGADLFVTKPFSVAELIARIKAIFRLVDKLLQSPSAAPQILHCGNMRIDAERHEVSMGGRQVDLTAKEFQLLLHFARNPGRVYSRMQLLEQVWGYQHRGYEHTVDSHINRLRAKIENNPDEPSLIQTIWGVGYKFNAQATSLGRTGDRAASSTGTSSNARRSARSRHAWSGRA